MKVNNGRILSVLLISFSLLINSCTLVGLGIGAVSDASRPDYQIVNPDDYKAILSYEEIIIFLKNNSSKVGNLHRITEKNLTIETEIGLERVNLDEILSVKIKVKKNGKRYGSLIGVTIDGVMFILIARSLEGVGGSSQ